MAAPSPCKGEGWGEGHIESRLMPGPNQRARRLRRDATEAEKLLWSRGGSGVVALKR